MHGKILVIAGSDSGGGAGIQADIKTINNFNCYATTAITALTAQNSKSINQILPVNKEFIIAQMHAIIEDIAIDAVKIGMVYDLDSLRAIFQLLKVKLPDVPIIYDPVISATTGANLQNPNQDFVKFVREVVIPTCYITTPNIQEAEIICNMKILNLDDMVIAANIIRKLGARIAFVKGGHGHGDMINDVLAIEGLLKIYESPRIETSNTHGSGCSLASAISCGVAQGMSIERAIAKARIYVLKAISTSVKPGMGDGTLNHATG